MKYTLALLWVIIITGIVFITTTLVGPGAINDDKTPNLPPLEKGDIVETQFVESSQSTPETYSENIEEGNNSFNNGDFNSAAKYYAAAVKIDSNSSEALTKLGNAYLKNNEAKNAETTFNMAKQLSPNSIEIKIGLIRSYLSARNIEAAKNFIWNLSTEEEQNDPHIKYYKGIILILHKDFETARQIFHEIVTAGTSEEEELINVIPDKLITYSQNFLDDYAIFDTYKEGDILYLEAMLAKTLTDVHEFEASIPLLYEVLNAKNNYRDAWLILGYAYLNTGKSLDAIDALTNAKEQEPEKPETLFYLGLAYFANDEIDKAIFYLEQAEKYGYEPKEQVSLKLGDLYSIKNRNNDAVKKYEEVITLNKTNINVYIKTIYIYIDILDKPHRALAIAEEVFELYPEEAMSNNLMGWALAANSKFEEAKKYLGMAIQLNPDFDAAYLNTGWLYEKQGIETLAKEYYLKAYNLGGNNSIANKAATRFNAITDKELQENYYQVNITSP